MKKLKTISQFKNENKEVCLNDEMQFNILGGGTGYQIEYDTASGGGSDCAADQYNDEGQYLCTFYNL